MDYHMQFLEFRSLLLKHGLSYAIYEISLSSPKTWTIICNFLNIFPFSKNMDHHKQYKKFLFLLQYVDYHMLPEFLFFSKNEDYHMQFRKILFLLPKCGLSYAFLRISFPSRKTWTV